MICKLANVHSHCSLGDVKLMQVETHPCRQSELDDGTPADSPDRAIRQAEQVLEVQLDIQDTTSAHAAILQASSAPSKLAACSRS